MIAMEEVQLSDDILARVAEFEAAMPESHFTEQTLLAMTGLPKGSFLFLHHVGEDTIRRWADAIGDLNPRFRDIDYARTTKYGRLVAPPLLLTSVCGEALYLAFKPRKARGFHSGSQWEFFQPVLEDDNIDFEGQGCSSVKFVKSRYSGHMIVYTSDVRYRNQRGELIGQCRASAHEMAGLEAVQSIGKNKDIGLYHYSEAEAQQIEVDKDSEEMRGDVPRYFEDVNEGDSIGHVVEGPWNMMYSLGYYRAAPNGSQGERLQRVWARHTTRIMNVVDPRINALVNGMLTHLDNDLAVAIGAPGAYDIGMERQCYVSTLFNNWVGDDGFLWKFNIQFRQFVIYGDTNWYRGAVTRKYVDDGKYCVDIEFKGVNQRDETTTAGTATVILPSREHGPVAYPTPPSA
jgi:acyl dehydratase